LVETENTESWTWFLTQLGDDLELYRNSNFTFVSDRQKLAMEELKEFNNEAYEWLNAIPPQHWTRSHFSSIKAKSDVLLNNMCEVFNGKLVSGRDRPIIATLEFAREYLMKRIVNVSKVIAKCLTGQI
ncbi:hypothetical protein Tco_0027928, partial [Tanacetum coccineum]